MYRPWHAADALCTYMSTLTFSVDGMTSTVALTRLRDKVFVPIKQHLSPICSQHTLSIERLNRSP